MTYRKVASIEVIFEDGEVAKVNGDDADRVARLAGIHRDVNMAANGTPTAGWVVTPPPKTTTEPVNSWGEDT